MEEWEAEAHGQNWIGNCTKKLMTLERPPPWKRGLKVCFFCRPQILNFPFSSFVIALPPSAHRGYRGEATKKQYRAVYKIKFVDKRGFGNKVHGNLIVTDCPDVVFLLKVFFLSWILSHFPQTPILLKKSLISIRVNCFHVLLSEGKRIPDAYLPMNNVKKKKKRTQ